jgi:hypothetical protein
MPILYRRPRGAVNSPGNRRLKSLPEARHARENHVGKRQKPLMLVESGGPSASLLGPNVNMKPVSKMFLDEKKIPGREELFLIHGIM